MAHRTYVTVAGETLPIIAFEAYGDEKYSSIIANANPTYADVIIFDDGVKLIIPDVDASGTDKPPWRL